ncbi:hypothetical protein F4703DRAFT_1965870 [Phycomyces blakesleeanus]
MEPTYTAKKNKKLHPNASQEEYNSYLLRKRTRLSDAPFTSAAIDLENDTEMDDGFPELGIVMENPGDYYDSDSSDEVVKDENNPRLTDAQVDVILLQEMTNESEAKTSETDDDMVDNTAHKKTHMRVLESFTAAMNDNSSGTAASKAIHRSMKDVLVFLNAVSPFKSKTEFILHALFNGDEDLALERTIKKIMYAMEMLLEVRKTTGKRLDFPKPDAVINFHLQAKNEVPVFKTSPVKSTNQKSKVHEFLINKPSEYIKHMLAIPGKTSQLSALLDCYIFTLDMSHRNGFMIIYPKYNTDFMENQQLNLNQGNKWKEDPLLQHPMLTFEGSDYWVGNVVEVQGYSNWFLLEKFFTKNGSRYANAFQVYGGHGPLLNHPDDAYIWSYGNSTNFGVQFCLRSNTSNIEDFKRIISGTSDIMRVVICPLNMYSDDKSGNDSKQYNVYDSYLLYFAAMPLEERNKWENTLFVCTSNHVLNAVEMLPLVVNDLVVLEKGVEMYSEDLGKYVLVVAPLLLFMGDNPRQSQLAMHKGTSSKCLCRRCIFPSPCLGWNHITGVLCFSPNGSKEFLRLKAFDQTKDMPIEILYTIPLGLIKYLIIFLWKQPVLTAVQKDSLQCVMSKLFGRESNLELIISAFHAVARLSSLVAVDEVTKVLHALDLFILTTKDKLKQRDFSFKPKLHLLHHLTEDMLRFGYVLQYETENSKQFNKFIHEHLFKTNRQATSQDVAKKFAKQFMCRHLCNDGSYIVEKRVSIEALRNERNSLVRKTFMMQEYQMIPSINANNVYSRNVVTDPYGNIEVMHYRTCYEFDENEVAVIQAIDIHLTRVPDGSCRLLNVSNTAKDR